ncbi:MAG TPA: sulfatase-like hydrolase/transferase [Candidatus Ratteibacteria bacterium]|jgi:arylsulfatase A-like enzyme|nr:sulfatase-like hydrolase/transferase [bacterium]HON06075.1 sulfatase-like hydrolase/transferase [bacterium]HPC28655.1 sulfatase-like hydrolase/transferase [bacterium]HRS05490.1 sulfatase-like hydrolase/transferase [Candidatus Ratteibacteria bacterium]HRV04678.1 sulfatase-like hydrolase/transferase [Candidatus Ratteibacteria bacterium]
MNNTEKTNVILILSDDQGYWAMGCSGNKEVQTPNIDGLAKSGVMFENFFCSCPVCSPARATLLTGRMPSAHGIHDWLAAGNASKKYDHTPKSNHLIRYLDGIPGYTDYLSKNGYLCGISGKWHLGDSYHPQKGFSFWKTLAKGGTDYYGAVMIKNCKPYVEQRYITDVITDNALEFLERTSGKNNPFYLSVHYTAPHSPWTRENHPKQTFDRYFNGCGFESVPYQVKKRPAWVKKIGIPVNDEITRRTYLSGYFTAIEEMDRNIGRILGYIEDNGLRKNTLVIFASDNGMNMGQHGVFGKGNATFPLNMFEESVKVPCIFSHPGVIKEGIKKGMLVSQYDIFPTLLDYLKIPFVSNRYMPGKSFSDVLKGKRFDKNNFVVVFDEYGSVRMIRTKKWKYVQRYPYGPDELYNILSDPSEEENLAGSIQHKTTEEKLRAMLMDWFLRNSEPGLEGVYQPVTGAGQIGPCGKKSKGRLAFK